MAIPTMFNLEEWVRSPAAADYDNIGNDVTGVGAKLEELINNLTDFCQENNIPFAALFSAGSRANGLESRYTSVCQLHPEEKVTPDVLLAAYIGNLGANRFLDNIEGLTAALEARAQHLNSLITEE